MVQSLERAFAILAAVAARPAGVSALAMQLDLPKSTVARLLSSLQALGAVERVDGRRWAVGAGVEALVGPAPLERSLAAVARPELARLVESLGEDAGVGVPEGTRSTTSSRSSATTRCRSATGRDARSAACGSLGARPAR